MTDSGISGDLYGSNTSLDTLINELWTLSRPETEETTDSQSALPDWSCEDQSDTRHKGNSSKDQTEKETLISQVGTYPIGTHSSASLI